MANLTRKSLTAMGVEDAVVDEIIAAHRSVVDEIKDERDALRDKASKVDELEKALADAKAVADGKADDVYKDKYEALKSEFDAYKSDITAKEIVATKESLYRKALKDAGVSEKWLDRAVKLADLESLELDGEVLKDAEKLTEQIKTDWSDCIATEGVEGAKTPTPPKNEDGMYGAIPIPSLF